MYSKRIKFFIVLSIIFLAVCLIRLAQMQIFSKVTYLKEVEALQRGKSHYLGTLRGRILDRNSKELAVDEPQYKVYLNYELSSVMDERVIAGEFLIASKGNNAQKAQSDLMAKIASRKEDIERVITKCSHFGYNRKEIENRIASANDRIWQLRTFQAWRKREIGPEIKEKYKDVIYVPISVAIADFEKIKPVEAERLELICKEDIIEMDEGFELLELVSDDDVFTAQFEFLGIEGIKVVAKSHRVYPYGSAASQTIGWVGKAENETLDFDDSLKFYLPGEVCGRQPGVEYACESLLRGKRGKVNYDIDNKLVEKTETQFGQDVQLTIDIELQKKIEAHLSDPSANAYYNLPTAAVVVDVKSGEILAMVSLPNFDLNRVRYDYGKYINDKKNKPMMNRVIEGLYPAGSIAKPLVLTAGLESGKIRANEVISCPAHQAEEGWPNCLIWRDYGACHDNQWANEGGNIGRNAIRGSCNIYFSHLADRIEPRILQSWLYKFGLGHSYDLCPENMLGDKNHRSLRQGQGVISNSWPKGTVSDFNDVPLLSNGERRYFGIGQGNMRVTPLQLANGIAAIARWGVYKPAKLFIEKDSKDQEINLGISIGTLSVVRDGMYAVVNETNGTANSVFADARFSAEGIKVYGKTGSTEKPEHAWFAGFAEGPGKRSIVVTVLVEGGLSGAKYAAPLGRDIIKICAQEGYLGKVVNW